MSYRWVLHNERRKAIEAEKRRRYEEFVGANGSSDSLAYTAIISIFAVVFALVLCLLIGLIMIIAHFLPTLGSILFLILFISVGAMLSQ